jgi:peptide/nickel transport system permease protein
MSLTALLRRLALLLAVVFAAATLNFVLPRIAPGDPVRDKLMTELEQGSGVRNIAELARAYNEQFGLDQPVWLQYLRYLRSMATFDFGQSIMHYPARVSDMMLAALPWTIGLMTIATLIAFAVGTLLGAIAAWPRAPRFVRWLMPMLMVFSAIPYYLVGLVLIYVFAHVLRWFPLGGGFGVRSDPSLSIGFMLEIAYHATLPAFSIVIASLGTWALGMRGMMVSVQGEDYMLYGEALGLRPRRLFVNYAMRNAILPQITHLALSIGHIATGSILVELVFGYPGLGSLLYQAVRYLDYFVIYGIVLVLILTIAIAMFLMDLLYPRLDPRVRTGTAT